MSVNLSTASAPLIIVADDQRGTRHLIHNILARDGFKVVEAKNGREALELFISSRPDLVLLDMNMPVLGGLDACIRIKELPEGNHVPVLMFTAYDEVQKVEQAFQAGASDFIYKPINPEELRHRVNRLLYLRTLEMKREGAEYKLQSSYERIRSLSRKVLRAYEEERVRLARELHDELGMALTTMKLNLQLLNKDLSGKGLVDEERLASMIEFVNDTLTVIRNKAISMRPPSLDDLGLIAVINNMVNELSRHTSIKAELNTTGTYITFPVEVETALYRCIQETLTNAARHSCAGKVVVKLDFNNDEVLVRVTDDGIGFDMDSGGVAAGRLGLMGIKERVALLDGDIEINSSLGDGTEIFITIPLGGY
jgi:signal transduction histidine kinase